MSVIREQDIQKQISDYLFLKKWFVIKNNTVGIFKQNTGRYIPNQARGLADLTAIREGRVIMFEVKKPKGKQSPLQKDFEDNWKKHGGEYYLVYSLNDVIEIIG